MNRLPPFGWLYQGLSCRSGPGPRFDSTEVCPSVLKVGLSTAVPLPLPLPHPTGGCHGHHRVRPAQADPHRERAGPGTHRVLATLQIAATLAGYRQMLRWAQRFESRRWAVETPAVWTGTWRSG